MLRGFFDRDAQNCQRPNAINPPCSGQPFKPEGFADQNQRTVAQIWGEHALLHNHIKTDERHVEATSNRSNSERLRVEDCTSSRISMRLRPIRVPLRNYATQDAQDLLRRGDIFAAARLVQVAFDRSLKSFEADNQGGLDLLLQHPIIVRQ